MDPAEEKTLLDLCRLLQTAICNNTLLLPPAPDRHNRPQIANSSPEPTRNLQPTDISLWGVPLNPNENHKKTNTLLLKFLRLNDFKPVEAFEMIQRTLKWENEETREKLRSRVKLLEKGMRENGSMVQIIDLKDSSIASMKDLKSVVQKLFSVVDDNYPKFVEQHIFVNVSFRYYAYRGLFSRNLSQRTKSRFIFAKPSKVTETLLKFISPENIPIQYGGLQRDDEDEFLENDGKASEMSIKGGASSTVVIPVTAPGVTVVWDIAIVGWGVNYQEEFIPDDEGSYKVLIRKEKKLDEPVRNSYYISEPGKVVLTVANRSAKKKKILYRSKSKPTVPVYNLINNPDMYSAQNNRKILISG